MERLEIEKKLKLKKFYERIYEHIKRNVKKRKITIRDIIGENGYGGERGKKAKSRNTTS